MERKKKKFWLGLSFSLSDELPNSNDNLQNPRSQRPILQQQNIMQSMPMKTKRPNSIQQSIALMTQRPKVDSIQLELEDPEDPLIRLKHIQTKEDLLELYDDLSDVLEEMGQRLVTTPTPWRSASPVTTPTPWKRGPSVSTPSPLWGSMSTAIPTKSRWVHCPFWVCFLVVGKNTCLVSFVLKWKD